MDTCSCQPQLHFNTSVRIQVVLSKAKAAKLKIRKLNRVVDTFQSSSLALLRPNLVLEVSFSSLFDAIQKDQNLLELDS